MTAEKKEQIAELQRRVDRMDDVVLALDVSCRDGGQHAAHCVDAAVAIRNALARAHKRVKDNA